MRVSVVGAGYVGLVTGACLASSGHAVTVIEADAARLALLAGGGCPIYEPGLPEIIDACTAAGTLTFGGTDVGYGGAEIIVVAVGTPPTESGAADTTQVHAAIAAITGSASPGATVLMKSTVPVGTGAAIAAETASRGFSYVSNPEFLREGSAVADWFHTDRIVIGTGDPVARERAHVLYAGVDAPFVDCDVTSAEMIKYAANAFLATKISFINEIANVCDRVGADVESVAYAIGLDNRIGPAFLNAGIGYGGSCFPKDTRALHSIAATSGYRFRLLTAVIEVNADQRDLAVHALRERLGGLSGRDVAVLGLTFKPNTDDTRESPALDIVEALLAAGARVRAYDPVGTLPDGCSAVQATGVLTALQGAEACIVAVEWAEFSDIDWAAAAAVMYPSALVFDGRNCLNVTAVRAAGLEYRGVGRPGAETNGSKR
jgi:UDPglucose 6-dehydrogenase